MILRRVGTKSKLASKIVPLFPKHNYYVELFFGAGGMFFNKPPCTHNILNDIDNDIYNLFMVLKEKPDEFLHCLELAPVSDALFQHWRKEKELDNVWRAVQFIHLSNFSLYGMGNTLKVRTGDGDKKTAIENFHKTIQFFKENTNVIWINKDFRQALKQISFPESGKGGACFIYADPPYLGTTGYTVPWIEQDSLDLFDNLQATGVRWAMSEFNHPFILEQAKTRGLVVHPLGDRRNLKNRREEILVCNYKSSNKIQLW